MNRDFPVELGRLRRSLRGILELEKSFGFETFEGKGSRREKHVPLKEFDPSEEGPLERLRKEVSTCVQCVLHRGRRQTVFGEGSLTAKLMFVGEAPGSEEDLQGRPFVGQAGKLLTKIIEAIGFSREEVYIANIIKCRPPGNRAPLPEEIHSCEPYLIRQIERIRPKLLCALGKYAAIVLVRKEEPISLLRGNFYDYQGIPVMPTFHPAYLLRNPSAKRLVWEDMKKLKAALQKLEKSP